MAAAAPTGPHGVTTTAARAATLAARAAAALPADLVRRHDHANGVSRWTVEQGIEMGRPSELTIEVTVRSGAIEAVRVGGSAVIVSEGTMDVPGP